ncbi:MAG: ACP S-malonyltransferase, partial [Planctomycetales bacterium]|nr:ACP S-malonyltransferase [Planctomycetales bacterium]NIM08730.1 ACP S-malonyltransferase [Planctomycetales bacterium]NIN08200.1 ACP S-malonyltransferase [Planctomycetales bacterium]NIN77328.1 ACP S-malonyltransferase [Planctomycetales bacterium]NIO34512.1 ACP S-malonyltransferase [Planctomycetales bacterium]
HTVRGGLQPPQPPIASLVTGKVNYNDFNARDILNRWIDHPQRVWDGVYETLSRGIETIVHVGPEPNLFPATFKRLSDNLRVQLQGRSAGSLGKRVVSGMARRPWLTAVLPSRTALFRAPFLQHVILEDWLLEQPVK